MLKKLIIFIIKWFDIKLEEETKVVTTVVEEKELPSYHKKDFLSKNEYEFYLKLKPLESKYKIVPQVNLASIIHKENSKYRTELFRNIDFAIFSYDYKELLLLVELNDRTHNNPDRRERDIKVKNICKDCGIEIVPFYTHYPNEEKYVIERIENEIKKVKEDNIEII